MGGDKTPASVMVPAAAAAAGQYFITIYGACTARHRSVDTACPVRPQRLSLDTLILSK